MFSELLNKIKSLSADIIGVFRERIILICCAAAIVLLVLISILLMINRTRDITNAAQPASISERVIIPPEELFLSEEPDFIPGVLLDREPRTSWTAEDVIQYWQDPLKDGEEPWRQHIEKTIDELMERVP